MGIVSCQEEDLQGELQKLEAPKLQDVIKIGEAPIPGQLSITQEATPLPTRMIKVSIA